MTGLTEEKVEKSLPRRAPVTGSQPMPSYPYGSPQQPPAPAASAGLPDPRGGNGYASEPALAPAGAWNRDGTPASGGWNGSGPPAQPRKLERLRPPGGPGSWNRNGTPADTGSWNRHAAPPPVAGGTVRHGQLEWHGRRGTGMLNALSRARTGPQAAGA